MFFRLGRGRDSPSNMLSENFATGNLGWIWFISIRLLSCASGIALDCTTLRGSAPNAPAAPVFAQNCNDTQETTPDGLIRFLQKVATHRDDPCVTQAIKRLGEQRYRPAIDVLADLLDYRRGPSKGELAGVRDLHSLYPAEDALEEIAEGSRAAETQVKGTVLELLKDRASSETAGENAVHVWMEIYRYTSAAKGVALLKREADRASDPAAKQQLLSSVEQALKTPWCRYPAAEQEKCKVAAQTGRVD